MIKNTVMIASSGSGKGKTTFVSALLNVLKDKNVHAFKCGPDYIDPMFHREVLNIPSANLDCFFCDKKKLQYIFDTNSGEINIIEAAMGLYDGIGTGMRASAYEVAKCLSCPIILLIDGHGMGYSIVAEIKGFLSMDSEKLIKGVVLNRVSEKYYSKIAPVIERETGIKLYGVMPYVKDAELESRHLGLKAPKENDFFNKLTLLSDQLIKSVDIDGIISLGTDKKEDVAEFSIIDDAIRKCFVSKNYTVAIAKDEAFSFIYDENVKLLEYMGISVVFFSPMYDEKIPKDVNALIFYGGYPENYAQRLSDNISMLESIRDAYKNGVKIIAECGGFMYLLDSITTTNKSYDMLGLIHGNAYRTNGLVRFGYVNIYHDSDVIKGHEFHHFEADGIEYSDAYTVENESQKNRYKGFVFNEKILAGFPHLYYLSNPKIIVDFLLD